MARMPALLENPLCAALCALRGEPAPSHPHRRPKLPRGEASSGAIRAAVWPPGPPVRPAMPAPRTPSPR